MLYNYLRFLGSLSLLIVALASQRSFSQRFDPGDSEPFESSLLEKKRQVYREKFSRCRSESLSEFSSGDNIEQQICVVADDGYSGVLKSGFLLSSRKEQVINAVQWQKGMETTPALNLLSLRNQSYDASAGIGSENRGVRELNVHAREETERDSCTICRILEGSHAGIDLQRRLSGGEKMLVFRLSENLQVVRPVVSGGSDSTIKEKIEWHFDERFGNCLGVRKTDDKGILTVENVFDEIDGYAVPKTSTISYPGGSARRVTYWRKVNLNDKPKSSEFYLSHYGFPEPETKSGFRFPIIAVAGLGVILLLAAGWMKYRKRSDVSRS